MFRFAQQRWVDRLGIALDMSDSKVCRLCGVGMNPLPCVMLVNSFAMTRLAVERCFDVAETMLHYVVSPTHMISKHICLEHIVFCFGHSCNNGSVVASKFKLHAGSRVIFRCSAAALLSLIAAFAGPVDA